MFELVRNAVCDLGVGGGDEFYVVSGTPVTSPSPIVTHFITSNLGGGDSVCLVLLHNTFGHYCNIGNKLGFNLKQYQEQGKLEVIEGLKLLCDVTNEVESPFSFINGSDGHKLSNLYRLIRKTVLPLKDKGAKVHLIVENVTSLLMLGVRSDEISVFARYCRNLSSGSLVMVLTSDECDDASTQVTRSLVHMATLHISMTALQTGQAKEVHGDLRLKYYDDTKPSQCLPSTSHMHYKMEDKNMKLFAPGMSANVL